MKRFTALLLCLSLLFSLALPGTAAGAAEQDASLLETRAGEKAATGGKLVAITFDDGPGPYTERLLDGLKSRGVKATFFMVGNRVNTQKNAVLRMYAEGHQLANHTWDHAELTSLSSAGVSSEVGSTNNALNALVNVGGYFVRAPYGSTNERVRSLVGAPLIYWSVDTLDWKYRNASTVRNNILNDTFDGAIILLHDIHSTSVDGALMAIDALLSRGYEFVTVRELFRRRGVSLSNGTTYYNCKPNGTDKGPIQPPVITTAPENGKTRVTITAQAGTKIYVSVDGSEPYNSRVAYQSSFLVSGTPTVKAIAAYHLNGARSATATLQITRTQAAAPTIRVSGGQLSFENNSPGTVIHYTLNGQAPTEQSAVYTGSVTLPRNVTIRATAGGENFYTSSESVGYYSEHGVYSKDLVAGAWFTPAMERSAWMGYLDGKGYGIFAPQDGITRGEFVTMIYRRSLEFATAQEVAAMPFTDVPEGRSYTKAVAWAKARAVLTGYPDNTFRPDEIINRQEMAQILSTYLQYLGLQVDTEDVRPYADDGQIPDWSRPAIEKLSVLGVLRGDRDGKYRPTKKCTRAEAATAVCRVTDLLGW